MNPPQPANIQQDDILSTIFSGGDVQKAYLNILEDMQDDKAAIEDQRKATFNILEDVQTAQEHLERKHKELDVIKTLTEKLGMSLDLRTVIENIVEALTTLFPDLTIAYALSPIGGAKIPNIIYVYTNGKIGDLYLDMIQGKVVGDLSELPIDNIDTEELEKWRGKKFYSEIVKGEKDPESKTVPSSRLSFPIVVPGTIAGIINLSAPQVGAFTAADLDVIHTIIASATQTISRLSALIASEHSRLGDLVESMTNGVIMFDTERKVTVVNPAIEHLTKLDPKTLTLEMFVKHVLEKNEKEKVDIEKTIAEVLSSGKGTSFAEVPLDHHIVAISITAVRDNEKNVAGGAIILQDITHMAEVDKMKTEFVSLASHQLRTPLSAIRWFLEMLQNGRVGEMTEKQLEIVQDTHECADRMMRLVNDLLNVSRLEQGRITITPEPTDLIALTEDLMQENRPSIEQHFQELVFNKPTAGFPQINVDPQLMRQVFTNLISNASKYTPDAGKITIELKKVEKNIDWRITDTGHGIPTQAQEHIFEKFFRAGNVPAQKAEGTGLGLYLAKQIVEQSGGTITFVSEEGKGTTFCVSLPMSGSKAKEGEKGLSKIS